MTKYEPAVMKRRILFVDDEPNVLDGLRRMLRAQQSRCDVNFVLSADEALERIHRPRFDAIVSDVMMPGKDGFELLAELRNPEHANDIPVSPPSRKVQGFGGVGCAWRRARETPEESA